MMQHIATSKTDIAALVPQSGNAPEPAGLSNGNDATSSEQFRHLLKEHQPRYGQPVEPRHPVVQSKRDDGRVEREQSASDAEVSGQREDTAEPDKVQSSADAPDTQNQADNGNGHSESEVQETEAATQQTAQEPEPPAEQVEEAASESTPDELQADESEATAAAQDESLVADLLALLGKVNNENTTADSEAKEDLQPELAALLAEESAENAEHGSAELPLTQQLQQLIEQLNDPESDQAKAQNILAEVKALLAENADSENPLPLQQLAEELGIDQSLLNTLSELEDVGVALTQILASVEQDATLETEELFSATDEVTEAVAETQDKPEQPISDETASVLEDILNLPKDKQDAVLIELARQIVLNDAANAEASEVDKQTHPAVTGQALSSQQVERQQAVLAALQNGVKEMQSQIKQGHNPGIDLHALVDQALNKLASEGNALALTQQQLSQSLQQFSQQFDLAQQARQSLDTSPPVLASVDKVGNGQTQAIQTEAQKSVAQQAQAERAVNITRPEGHQQLTDKVRYMVSNQQMHADIRLDPPELGSMKVRVNLSGESASVNFVVQSQQAREVLEHNAPRLKELLEEQGIELGQSFVQQESDNQSGDTDGEFAGMGSSEQDLPDEGNVTEQRVVNGRLGGIDYFV